jgi:hypothetical protein
MSASRQIELSVVVVTPDNYEAIRAAVRHLRQQTARDQLELVIVCPSKTGLRLDEKDLNDFPRWQVVEAGEFESSGFAIAAGVLAANAPVVGYVEEHSFPEPGWAEALIRAHRQGWAAVGWEIHNANPSSLISWSNLLTDFAPWVAPAPAGEVDRLPPHHTSYKRDRLLAYGRALGKLLETEAVLQADLRGQGHRFYLEPAAKSRHVNISKLSSYLLAEWLGGRVFGAARMRQQRWSIGRRLLYIIGSPLIPLVRLRRLLRQIRRIGRQQELLPAILPVMMLALIAHTLGEMAGYAGWVGHAARSRRNVELHRLDHVADADKSLKGVKQ